MIQVSQCTFTTSSIVLSISKLFISVMPICHTLFILFVNSFIHLLAHLSRRLIGELIVYPWSGVRPSSSSTISNMYISATSWPITTKFYLKHHWVWRKAALGFGPDQIRTLVSMATESSHRVTMEKTVSPLFLG